MNKTKVWLKGVWCIICVMLFCAGLSLININSNNVAKADDNYEIRYHAICTSGEVFTGKDSTNGNNLDTYVDVILNKDTKKVTATKKLVDTDGNTIGYETTTVDCIPGKIVSPMIDSSGADLAPIVFNGEAINLGTTFVNGIYIDPSFGWMYESAVGDTITLTSLCKTFNSNTIPANFIENAYSPSANSETKIINLYCIINPFTVWLNATDNGNYGIQIEHGEEQLIRQRKTTVMFMDVKDDFEPATPDNTSEWRFDGYYTTPAGGLKITDRYGSMHNGEWADQGWVSAEQQHLYAHYTRIFNIEFYYNFNNRTYHGATQFDLSSNVSMATLNSAVAEETAYDTETNATLAFPADKVVAGWYKDQGFTQPVSFPLLQQNATLYAKLANSTYSVTFNANGGQFINDRGTTITYSVGYNKTLGEAITKLTDELGSNVPVATRKGYDCNNRNWSISADSTTSLNRTIPFVTEDKEVFLIWTVRTYKIEYHTGGTLSKTTDNVNYDQDLWNVVSKVKPTRTGYNFIGWSFSNNTSATSYTLETRPAGKILDFDTTTTLTFIRNESNEADREFMPDHNIEVYGVWIQAYTVRFAFNQGEIPNISTTPLVLSNDKKAINITIENGETLGQALTRQELSDFFSNTRYQPSLASCIFEGWYYYSDGDFTNNEATNIAQIDNSMLNMNVKQLKDRNIDVTRDNVIAAKYTFNKDTFTYTTAPEDTSNTFFAIILMVISVILLVTLIMTHRGNSRIEVNDKAIDAYKEIYGEDAPLPTFESTKPPFEVGDETIIAKQDDNKTK